MHMFIPTNTLTLKHRFCLHRWAKSPTHISVLNVSYVSMTLEKLKVIRFIWFHSIKSSTQPFLNLMIFLMTNQPFSNQQELNVQALFASLTFMYFLSTASLCIFNLLLHTFFIKAFFILLSPPRFSQFPYFGETYTEMVFFAFILHNFCVCQLFLLCSLHPLSSSSLSLSLNLSYPSCGFAGWVGRCCHVVGPSPQWLWPWHCVSLTLSDLWVQWLHSQPSWLPQPSLSARERTGRKEPVMEESGGQSESSGKREGKYVCMSEHTWYVDKVQQQQFCYSTANMHITWTRIF